MHFHPPGFLNIKKERSQLSAKLIRALNSKSNAVWFKFFKWQNKAVPRMKSQRGSISREEIQEKNKGKEKKAQMKVERKKAQGSGG